MGSVAGSRPGRAEASAVGLGVYGGLFFTTLGTLMYEILLTRVFSVTMWYHFAFVAVSVALFGLTVGALIIHLRPAWFPEERTRDRLVQASVLFSASIVVSFVTQLAIPFRPEWSVLAVYSVVLTYLVIAVPFIFSGIVVALSLTRFPHAVGRLYAADLVGAGLGTVTLIWLLNLMGDAPSAVLAIAALSAMGAVCYAAAASSPRATALAGGVAVILALLAAGNAVSAQDEEAFLRVIYAKGDEEEAPLFETWNAFSRIRVTGDPQDLEAPATLRADAAQVPVLRQLSITIDATAGTTMTAYDGDKELLRQYFRDYVVNLPHFVWRDSDVLIVGTGGGWDVLAALAFDQPSITGVEMNGAILEAVNGRYGEFTGHLDEQPGIRFVNEEARSYLARTDEEYDIILVPMTDTWAATAAGAFALSENGLYTVEAWETFYDRLADGGVLSVTRWFVQAEPVEAYRLTALAAESLRAYGIEQPSEHVMLVRSERPYPGLIGVATVLVSKTPLAPERVRQLRDVGEKLGFIVELAPDAPSPDPVFDQIVKTDDIGSIDIGIPANISAPTDDRPFFFQMIRLRDVFRSDLYGGFNDYLARPVLVLVSLGIAVLALTAACIVLPLVLSTSRRSLAGMAPFVVFFCAIGLGFLLLEISQMQRLVIFLGHPTYALSVVLFSLLIFSGIGSLATEQFVSAAPGRYRVTFLAPLAGLLVVLIAFAFVTPAAIDAFRAETTSVRIALSVAILAPMGFLMGMPFPIGMKAASLRPNAPTAFFWGVNGATSVCASVLAVVIAMGWGISSAFWTGVLAYVVAAAALAVVVLRRPA